MENLADVMEQAASRARLSGVTRVDAGGDVVCAAYGLADRAHHIPNMVETRFAIASGSKSFTAVMVMRLIELGALTLDTTARSLLGGDLPLIDDAVTVEQLLAHRSGIGDYLDESNDDYQITDYVMTVPVHRLAATEGFLPALDGYPMRFPPGDRFEYCNAGYVVLALLAERAVGIPFHDLVQQHVFDPAGMTASAYLRSDELPGDAAVGYLFDDGLRTNVLHLPVRGSGDGGAYTTVADIHRFWSALFGLDLLGGDSVEEMFRPRGSTASGRTRYGFGFWLGIGSDAVEMEGGDAGVSFRSVHQPSRGVTYTVAANAAQGAWQVADRLAETLAP